MALGLLPQEIIKITKNPLLAKADDWNRIKVKEIAKVLNGYAFKSSRFNKHKIGTPVVRIRDVGKPSSNTYYEGEYESSYIIDDGDIIIGMDGDFKLAVWNGGKALLNQRVCKIVPDDEKYNSKFLTYVLQPYLDEIHKHTSSVTVKHLSSRTILDIPLPLPPLPEQHRIVAKIEEIFSELDKGVESLKKAKEQLKTYRQAVLKAAFEGRLADRETIMNRLPKNWSIKEFNEVATVETNLVKPELYKSHPHIAPDNIERERGTLISYNTIEEDGVKSPKHLFFPGQIIYSKIRPYLNKLIVATFEGLCSADMYPIETNLETKYLYYFMLSDLFVNQASTSGSRSVLPKINQKELSRIKINVAPPSEQSNIVQEIESRLSFCYHLEKSIEQGLQQSKSLRQSILKKAFEGKLLGVESKIEEDINQFNHETRKT